MHRGNAQLSPQGTSPLFLPFNPPSRSSRLPSLALGRSRGGRREKTAKLWVKCWESDRGSQDWGLEGRPRDRN